MGKTIPELEEGARGFRYVRIGDTVTVGAENHVTLARRSLGDESQSLTLEVLRQKILELDADAGAGFLTRIPWGVWYGGDSTTLGLPVDKEKARKKDGEVLRINFNGESFEEVKD